jgi:hypothetical protein
LPEVITIAQDGAGSILIGGKEAIIVARIKCGIVDGGILERGLLDAPRDTILRCDQKEARSGAYR